MGDMGVFSFGAPKIITTGQGGCIITNDKGISDEIVAIKNFGRTVKVGEVYNVMGSNFKFTDLQASFGVPQMKKLPFIVEHKKHLFKWYCKHLKGVVDFINTDLEFVTPTYPEILVSKRDELVLELREEGIGCRAVYDSLCNQPFHSKWKTSTPVTNELAKKGLHLPAQFDLREQDIKKICDVIKNHAA
jgi:perosamine synthetase